MEPNELQTRIISPFIGETIDTLSTMAGLHATTGDSFMDNIDEFRFKGYAVAAETHGKLEGYILIHLYIETTLSIGNKVLANLLGLDEEYEEMNDDIADAVAEWGNTIIGRATRVLESEELGISFRPPFFVYNTEHMYSIMKETKEIISFPVHIEDVGRFYINYLLNDTTQDMTND